MIFLAGEYGFIPDYGGDWILCTTGDIDENTITFPKYHIYTEEQQTQLVAELLAIFE